MPPENLPTLDEITKQLEEATAKKKAAQPNATHTEDESAPVLDENEPVQDSEGDPNPEPVEEKEPEVKVPEKKEDPFSKRFAALTRADKLRRQKEAEFERKMAEFEARVKAQEEREARTMKVSSAMEALKAHGFRYDDATSEFLGMKPEAEPDPVEQKVRGALDPIGKKLSDAEQRLAEVTEKLKYFEQMQQQQSEREIRYAIQATMSDGGYTYIPRLGDEGIQHVYDVMVEYFQKHKQSLTYKQACDRVEGYFKRIAEPGDTKIDTVPDTKVPKKAKPASEESPAKTLTQSHQAAPRSKQNLDDLSPAEAKKKLATMLKWR